MNTSGAFRERLLESWIELRANPGRSFLQALGVMLGVASVLGGFSISDSQRQQAERLFARLGGIDKLNVLPTDTVYQGTPSALRSANLGLRLDDAVEGGELPSAKAVDATSVLKQARARVRSEFADQERDVSGIGADYVALNGYEIEQGRGFSAHDVATGAPVAVLGAEAAGVFFPTGEIVGKPLRIGDVPVTVIGVFQEKIFRFQRRAAERLRLAQPHRRGPLPADRRAHGGRRLPPRRPRHLPHPESRGDGRLLPRADLAGRRQPPPAGGLPPRRRGQARRSASAARATSTTSSSCSRASWR